MKKYKQLTLGQRYQIQSLLQVGLNQTTIANQLGVPRRGRTALHYIGEHAQRKTDHRHSTKEKQVLLTENLKARIAALMNFENGVQNSYPNV